jgi:flavin reductase (DIM6/NTAB) family NADH-FMN oxidoreductase RutF
MDKEKIGQALGRVPSGLFIVTVKHEEQEDAVLASWVSQCAFEPPVVSIMLAETRPARLLVEASRVFVLNILGQEDRGLLKRFSKPPKDGVPIFDGIDVREGRGGIKILMDAVAYLECEVVQQTRVGDHVTYFGRIVGGEMLRGGAPYVHVRQNGFNY